MSERIDPEEIMLSNRNGERMMSVLRNGVPTPIAWDDDLYAAALQAREAAGAPVPMDLSDLPDIDPDDLPAMPPGWPT